MMPGLHTLTDLFAELEQEADAAPLPEWPQRRSGRRALLPAAAAACVLAGVGVGVYVTTAASGPAHDPAGSGPDVVPATSPVPATLAPSTNARSASPSPSEHLVFPPATTQQLFTEAQQVLGTVAGAGAELSPAQGDESFSTGTLSAGGVSGGYLLNVIPPGSGAPPLCSSDVPTCDRRTLPDGTELGIQTVPLQTDPGGLSYYVAARRPDGVVIDFIVSNAADPKGGGPNAAHVPLTIDQMTAFVASPKWDSYR